LAGLDVDLDLERIEHPENFPLVASTKPRLFIGRKVQRFGTRAKVIVQACVGIASVVSHK
jgi:hypothetical protein